MSGAGSLADLVQQIISNAYYRQQTYPKGGGGKLDRNKQKG